ncbi:MAG: hypothetical protein M3256_22715 [Actinomycetota bacterium]|nr:hypothetical protein [Actinomycetota bacterium]
MGRSRNRRPNRYNHCPRPLGEDRLANLGANKDRIAGELSDDPDHSMIGCWSSIAGRRMAALWVPSGVTVVLLVVYKLTLAVAPTIV